MHSTFPSKVSKITPVFKSGDKYLIANYRPISTLPFLFKAFENIIYQRIINFINKHQHINMIFAKITAQSQL
ncbi:hypothetical protein CAPTEDRAFT_93425 [Capitella teleta]|uniref:Reverse transcriptase domain-containing protein n=1 Tax=Capitella teleta TaxID=283909 RepID=R7VL60_CAPTE|nr:hypothetical protein CAPTEDRAFT_93425 [Capitella teleta]|eukprot:ELU17335.1 hypothetical protein CAPTEDRAFT_93425 [Capitella teleta]